MKSIALPTIHAESSPIKRPAVLTRVAPYISMGFVAIAILVLILGRTSPIMQTLSIVFVSIVLEAMPFVLLGAIVGGVIEVYLPREKVSAWLPKNPVMQVLIAGGMGVIFPVCECAVIPVARRLMKKGVPFSAAAAYLLAGPIVNPLVAASTAVAYLGGTVTADNVLVDWKHVMLVRMISGYIVAVVVAFILGKWFPGSTAFHEEIGPDEHDCCEHDHEHDHDHSHEHTAKHEAKGCTDPTHHHDQTEHSHAEHSHADHDHAEHAHTDHAPHVHDERDDVHHQHHDHSPHAHAHEHAHAHAHEHPVAKSKPGALSKIGSVFSHATDDFLFVGQFLVIGAFIAALFTTLLNREFLMQFSHTPGVGIGTMMVMAVFLSICSEADAFVAASFRHAMPLSGQMAFMVLGPMLDFKLIAMYLSFMKKPAVAALIGLIAAVVFTLMMTLHALKVI